MTDIAAPDRICLIRQVFPAWSIAIPPSFEETFVDGDSYWHAWDVDRSISLTSILIWDGVRPVGARRLARRYSKGLPGFDGDPVDEVPPGLDGVAVMTDAIQPARASRVLAGLLFAEGRVLLVSITADDLAWARRTWMTIRAHEAPLERRVTEPSVPAAGPRAH